MRSPVISSVPEKTPKVHDQRRFRGIGIAHVEFREGFEGASDTAEEVLHVLALCFVLLDSRLSEIDAYTPESVVRDLLAVAGD